jgi:hypothetical protein
MRNYYLERLPTGDQPVVVRQPEPQPQLPVVPPLPNFCSVSWATPKPEPGTRQKIEAVICKVLGFVFVGLIVLVLVSALAPILLVAWVLWPTAVLAVVVISALLWQLDETFKAREDDKRRIIREELEKFHGRR